MEGMFINNYYYVKPTENKEWEVWFSNPDIDPNAEFICTTVTYQNAESIATSLDGKNKYAKVVWTVNDIIDTFKDVTVEQAEDWLSENESGLESVMTERGWDYIYQMFNGEFDDSEDDLYDDYPEDNVHEEIN